MNNSNIKSMLHKAIRASERRMAFFVGAGVSIDSGLPNFWAFGKHMVQCVTGRLLDGEETLRGSVLTETEVDLLVSELRPEVLLQTLFDAFGERVFDF